MRIELRGAFASLSRQSRALHERLAELTQLARDGEVRHEALGQQMRARGGELEYTRRQLALAEADAQSMQTERDAAVSARLEAQTALQSRDEAIAVRICRRGALLMHLSDSSVIAMQRQRCVSRNGAS